MFFFFFSFLTHLWQKADPLKTRATENEERKKKEKKLQWKADYICPWPLMANGYATGKVAIEDSGFPMVLCF